jgi:Flp pilus assembly pilin Flp
MGQYVRILLDVGRDCRGVTFLEYAMIAGIIAATIVIGFTSLAGALSGQFVALSARL